MQAMHQVCAVGSLKDELRSQRSQLILQAAHCTNLCHSTGDSGHDDGDWWMLLPVDGLCWLYDDGNEVAMIYWWIGPCKVWKQEDG